MKSTKIMYWVSTVIICLFASTAIMMNSKMAIDGTTHLGIPRWLGLEVSISQLIGLVLLIVPAVAHILVKDPIGHTIMAIAFFGLLILSYSSFHKLQAAKGKA